MLYKNNSRGNSKYRRLSPHQLSCILTEIKSAVGYYFYNNRCELFKQIKYD